MDKLPERLRHYPDPNDYNRIFYHQRNDDMEEIIHTLLNASDSLLALCETDYEEATEYLLFARCCLSDQMVVESEKRLLRTKVDGTMNSKALQNPSDPNITYRNKAAQGICSKPDRNRRQKWIRGNELPVRAKYLYGQPFPP